MHFNPRAPYGARHIYKNYGILTAEFQSTRPVWGATDGGDIFTPLHIYFNPRAPYGARLYIIILFINYS